MIPEGIELTTLVLLAPHACQLSHRQPQSFQSMVVSQTVLYSLQSALYRNRVLIWKNLQSPAFFPQGCSDKGSRRKDGRARLGLSPQYLMSSSVPVGYISPLPPGTLRHSFLICGWLPFSQEYGGKEASRHGSR